MIFIVAGSKSECTNYTSNKGLNPRNVRYIARDISFRGDRIGPSDEVRFVGTWFKKKDIKEIMNTILLSTTEED